MPDLDRTHDPDRRSWVASANTAACHFPIQNLPFGIFSMDGQSPRAGVAIGDRVLDLSRLAGAGLLSAADPALWHGPDLNPLLAAGPAVWRGVRLALSDLLEAGNPSLRDAAVLRESALVPMAAARLHLPIFVRSFTDFYASREHATNVGALFRGRENALPPNWLHIPIGYNGRASTVVVSGTDFHRPLGQLKAPEADAPTFGPCRRLDFELELGAIVGTGSELGRPVTTGEAYDMIFGYVLLNDWSARDIQTWEYQPLGPFQSKAFATTISPWIVTRDALEPYRIACPERVHPLLPYLQERTPNNFDIHLEASLAPAGGPRGASVISRTNSRHLYYSAAQQLAHHAVSGCRMCTGDLLGSGTISGPTRDSLGALVEMTRGGSVPVLLECGATRTFLEDGDRLALTGWCEGRGHRVGFGECSGTVLPAPCQPEW
ncbi:MAG: fumarylacetoacetase [Hyphomicrobiaceae bacterium]|nr:fumarylacetoacetase [Hyphomicrobiaceae bacterium]